MATVHSSRTCLPKLCCSITVVGLLITGILVTGAYPHPNLINFNLNQTDTITNDTNLASTGNITFTTEEFTPGRVSRSLRATATAAQNKALQTILLAKIFRNTDTQAAILHKFFNQISHSKSRVSRSPRALKMVQALEAAIAKFQTKPEPQYQISEYATGNKRWKREPSVYPFQVTDLLEYEVHNKHSQNKILGEKVAQILHQNTDLSGKIAEEYQTPSEKLKKDPIMALVTRTISTYMLVKHSKNGKEKADDLSPWGEPFFKKKE
jgi:hypothetical protein